MLINLFLVRPPGCLSGQQPLEKAVYLPTTKNSLKTNKEDLSFYGATEHLPTRRKLEEESVSFSDVESISSSDSGFSSFGWKRRGQCVSRNSTNGMNKEELWMYIYAQSLGSEHPYECDCELFD